MTLYNSSFLSSVYVKSIDAGATLKINYFDTTTGNPEDGERYDLLGHDIITDADVGKTFRIVVDKVHNKPQIEAIVTGGNVEFGIYITAIDATSITELAQGASTATTENSAVGSNGIYVGTLVAGVPIQLPAIAGNFINSFILDNIGANNIEFSFNNVAPFYILTSGNNFAWTCQATKQITIKGDGNYQMIINLSGVS